MNRRSRRDGALIMVQRSALAEKLEPCYLGSHAKFYEAQFVQFAQDV
jgi:hypothetical protein